jgi:hypothetical protein
MWKWFSISWYRYLFEKVPNGYWNKYGKFPGLRTIICRAKGHPAGVVYYNPTGFEPDMTCKNCGDDLG